MHRFSRIQDIIDSHKQIVDDLSKEELIKKLYVYYEELIFHNKALRQANEKILDIKDAYQELFDFAPISYFIINDKGVILDANRNAKNLFGNLVGQSIVKYVDINSRKDLYIFLRNLVVSDHSRVSIVLKIQDAPVHMEIV